MSLPIVRHILVAVAFGVGGALTSHAESSIVVANPLEYGALAAGNDAINNQISNQMAYQIGTSALQNTIAGEYSKIHEWEKQYNRYLKKADGYASTLKASTTIYNEGVRIFISLVKLKEAIGSNPQGVFATMSMNNLYMETAAEMVSVFTLLKTAVAEGGEKNMLTGSERSETLWAINDKIHSFHKKLQKLTLSIQYYTLNDVWSSATVGMVDKSNGTIAKEAKARWKRVAKSIH